MLDLPPIVTYARAHGLAVDHSKINHNSLLTPMLEESYYPSSLWDISTPRDLLLEDLTITAGSIELLEQIANPKHAVADFTDHAEWESNSRVHQLRLEEPELCGPQVPSYLSRVAPFAYMGDMNIGVEDDHNVGNWLITSKPVAIPEKLQVKAEDIEYLAKVTNHAEIITSRVFIFPSLKTSRDKFSSPLLPASPEPGSFDPAAELMSPISEHASSKWSPAETFSPLTSDPRIATPSASVPKKRTQQLQFSSPLLKLERVSKRIKLPEFPQTLEEAPPTAYSKSLEEDDSRLFSQMRQSSSRYNKLMAVESLVESDNSLRLEVPLVESLEKSSERRERIIAMFPKSMKDLKTELSEWRRPAVKSGIRWRPFLYNKEEIVEPKFTDEDVPDFGNLEPIITVVLEQAFTRSKEQDWELSDLMIDEEEFRGHATTLISHQVDLQTVDSGVPMVEFESLDELILSRKGRNSVPNESLSTLNERLLPLTAFQLFSSGNQNYDDREIIEDNKIEKEQLYDERMVQQADAISKTRQIALKKLGITAFDSGTTLIFNTTFLTTNSQLYRDVLACTSDLKVIERDYGNDEADILLSSSCSVLVFSFSQILQRALDGTRIAVARAQVVWERVKNLLVLIRVAPNVSMRSPSDWAALTNFMETMAGIRTFIVKDSDELDVVKWIIDAIKIYGGKGIGVAETDTTWERFFRAVGVNGYAAQEILKQMDLKTFIEIGHSERLSRFGDLCGAKLLNMVTRVLEAPLSVDHQVH